MEENEKVSPASFLDGFDSWNHLLRFTGAIAAIGLVIVLCVQSIGNILLPSGIEVSFVENGIALTSADKERHVMLILPSSQIWLDTQIDLEQDESAKLIATGKIHLSINKLVEADNQDKPPLYPWVEASGDLQTVLPGDDNRNGLLIYPKARFGALLAYVQTTNEKPSKTNSKPKEIQFIGKKGMVTNNSNRKGRLWLTINDFVLSNNEASKEMFLMNQESLKIRYNRTTEQQMTIWKEIVAKQYWELFFDDNIS